MVSIGRDLGIGDFVRDLAGSHGPGKVVEISNDAMAVEYFASVNRRFREWVPATSSRLVPYQPSPQERCYVESNALWRMGRIKNLPDEGAGQVSYYVQYPNQEFGEVAIRDLYVRWWEPCEEPLEALLLHAHETPYFHQRRWQFASAQVEQRAASRGLGGILSSAVALHPHQIDVVRRVMEDSVQRYLLADEVGLGKTVEAGMIARQVLIDNPLASVLVLVPPQLKDQWQRELDSKFFVSDFADAVQLLSLPEFEALSLSGIPDLLIVDEAHHVAARAFSDLGSRSLYKRVTELAHESRSLLLLSATPVRHHEASFLGMLHMLEPDIYPLDDLEGFSRRLRARGEIARTLDAFTEEAAEYPFLLEDALEVFERLFPDDKRLTELAGETRRVIAAGGEDRQVLRTCVRLTRVHIAETYRLHRRMVRYRRDGPAGDLVRGRVFAGTIVDLDSRRESIDGHLHLWLQEIASATARDADQRCEYLELARSIIEAAGTWLEVLSTVLRNRIDQRPSAELARSQLTTLALLPGEASRLQHLLSAIAEPSDADRITALLEWVRVHAPLSVHQPPCKVVVFTSYESVALEIAKRLEEKHPRITFACHHAALTAQERSAALDNFANTPCCSLLICDSTAEEGLNLQIADIMIHFDLPWHADRIEQRIGRVDRYGRGPAVRSVAFDDSVVVTTLAAATLSVMRDGFGVFDRSISSLQVLTSDELDQMTQAAVDQGAVGLMARTVTIADRAQEMLRDARQQDQVDAVALQSDVDLDGLVESIVDCEAASLAERHDGWFEALGFKSSWQDGRQARDRLVTYIAHPDKALISWNQFNAGFMRVAGPSTRRVSTYSRMASVRNPGAHLLRYGEPLVDAMRSYLNVDDRGQAFAFWRCGLELASDVTRGVFRADFVIEADLAVATSILDEEFIDGIPVAVLRRRLDAVFPPMARTIWIGDELDQIEDPLVLDQLSVPYEGDAHRFRDTNISLQRISLLEDLYPPTEWEQLCRVSESRARDILRRQTELDVAVEEGTKRVQSDWEVRSSRILARMSATRRERDLLKAECDQERVLLEALCAAIQQPRVRLDSMGCVVLSDRDPFADMTAR